MSQYDNISGDVRIDYITRADFEHQERLNRQQSFAQTCAEEIGEVVIRVDMDDEESMRASVDQINAIAANARIFILEALDNKRLRKALKG